MKQFPGIGREVASLLEKPGNPCPVSLDFFQGPMKGYRTPMDLEAWLAEIEEEYGLGDPSNLYVGDLGVSDSRADQAEMFLEGYRRILMVKLKCAIDWYRKTVADPQEAAIALVDIGILIGHLEASFWNGDLPRIATILNGRKHARAQWDSESRAGQYRQAMEEADRRWRGRDPDPHHIMARKLCKLTEFNGLSEAGLREKLKPVAKKHGKLFGVKKTLG